MAELPGEEAKSSLAQMDVNDAQIARAPCRAWTGGDPQAAANGDAALQKLVDGGNQDAAPAYIGKLSPEKTDRLGGRS